MTDTDAPQPDAAVAVAVAAAALPHPWSNLGPEQFRLLRLAPLPTDRYTGVRSLRFVQFGRVARHSPDQSLLRLSLELPGQRVRKEQNVLEVWVDHRSNEVRFGLDSGLHIEPINRGLGRFLLAQGIAWAKQKCAHYQVEGGALAAKDLLSDDARLRRDHFLRVQGFDVDYPDPRQLKATYSAARVNALNSDWQKEKVQIVELLDAAAMLQQADQNLREQEVTLRKQDERLASLTREDGTLRFTITCLVAFCVFQAGLLIWMATR
ncbi:hypothetical protein [Pseudomonas cavernicola]|uniref:hypothetical protein n=1 Tax=Pseudomonas cavernicola TaxID=2320866 RepID=UPI0015B35CA7|nr:hypothetical protein [Pseudomonas cavernicola]